MMVYVGSFICGLVSLGIGVVTFESGGYAPIVAVLLRAAWNILNGKDPIP